MITNSLDIKLPKTVIKRNGEEVPFDFDKIKIAITKANNEVSDKLSDHELERAYERIKESLSEFRRAVDIEEIQDIVEFALMRTDNYEITKAYMVYRYIHKLLRENENPIDGKIMSLVEYTNEEVKQENSNKNPKIIPTQRDYIAGEVSKDISFRKLLPKEIYEAHKEGIIHFHDSDYFVQHSHNCCLVNLKDMLQHGSVISGTMIEKPHIFSTACNIATQIVAQVASSQYGGQTISIAHLSTFVDETRLYFMNKYPTVPAEMIQKMVKEDIKRGVQIIQYQVVTLMTTNGQTPFITAYMDINEAEEGQQRDDLAMVIAEILKQRIQGVKNECGVWIAPTFPKLIYALDENNVYEDSEYFWLTELAAECTAKRMVPDYISNKVQRELKKNDTYPCMGCRSFLTPDRTEENYANDNEWTKGHKYYGRFNQGVVTINLPDIALSSAGDFEKFWDIFDDRLENLCKPALMARHNRLKGTVSDVAPILWQNGALARLKKGEKIDELLYHGYSTLSLGYAGLYECVKAMTGESHTSEKGKKFGLEVMQKLNDYCAKWKAETDIDFSLYGTPIESTTYKFAKCLQKRFGVIAGVTDKNYITNSYHVHVTEPIDAFSKLSLEAEFQALSPGGAVSYVEVPNMQNNLPAVESLMRYIYDHIMYAEINTKLDYCHECGYSGEIKIVKNADEKLVWECPNCGNRDESKMNVIRRTCGYLGGNFWNQGRTQEIYERVLHL